MTYELIFSARSEEDTKTALTYYDNIDPKLGDRFLQELLDIYVKLSTTPQYYSFISSVRDTDIRDVKLPSFPYLVVYAINNTSVNIISVLNSHKRPLYG